MEYISKYRHQLDYHKNRRHAPISLQGTWESKFCPDHNFPWYIAMSEGNTALESGNFQNYGAVQPIIDFFKSLINILPLEYNRVGIGGQWATKKSW